MIIAFQGEHGAYSEEAAIKTFGAVETVPCYTFEEVFDHVKTGRADRGILPLENSIGGTIHRNYDLLLERGMQATGEVEHMVDHCLLALPGTPIELIGTVESHPQALAQCEQYLRRELFAFSEDGRGVEVEEVYDTAGAAKELSQHANVRGATHTAVIASRRAAEIYGLEILAEHIQDHDDNFTRFALIGGEPQGEPNKSLVVFNLRNEIGALEQALRIFTAERVNLTKLESRPVRGEPWEYHFYAELEWGHRGVEEALRQLGAVTTSLTVLGHYCAWKS